MASARAAAAAPVISAPALSTQQKTARAVAAKPWYLYLLRCRNGALYAGIATSVETRFAQHVAGRGAKYTRSNPPLELLGSVRFPDRATASRAEHAIRQLRPADKLAWLREQQPRRRRKPTTPRPQ